MITVYLFDHGWFWMIPLPDDIMSVGVVGTRAFFKAKGSDLDALFARSGGGNAKPCRAHGECRAARAADRMRGLLV